MQLAVTAAGMVTPVGFNCAASCAAMRAGIRDVRETNLWDAEAGEYLAAGRVMLPQWWLGTGKLAELVSPAIHECFAATSVPREDIPVLLGVCSQSRPFRSPSLDQEILPEIGHRLEMRLHSASVVIPHDRASVVAALRKALGLIASGQVPCCIIAAVDSYVQQSVANHYLDRRRLLSSSNSNGFSPGEAGGAILVTAAGAGGLDELIVLGTGIAQERATIESGEPLRGEGLTDAIGEAVKQSGIDFHDLHYRISDLNGEHYRFKEMVLAMVRYERRPRPRLFDLWHPAEYIGDPGAAIGPIALAIALDAARQGYGVGSTALCTFGNDDGERAAAVVRFVPARGEYEQERFC